MPRPLTPPSRDQFPPHEQEDYDSVMARFNRTGWRQGDAPPTPDLHFGSLLHSPPFAAARNQLSSLVRTAGERDNTYSHVDREFVDQVLAVELGTNVVQKRHIPDGLAAGVRIEAIDALRSGDDDALTDDERLLARFIRQVVRGTVDDETFDAIEERIGTRGVVEYTFFITILWLTIRMYQAFGAPDPSEEEIDRMLQEFRDGTVELPDWKQRIR